MIPYAEPANLTAVVADGSVILDWDDNTGSDITGYNVYRSLTSGTGYSKVNSVPVSVSTYTDTGVTNGQSYFYVVKASNSSQEESGASDEVAITYVGISTYPADQPHRLELYPNPASGECSLRFSLEQSSSVSVSIFDVSGREIHHFIDRQQWKPGKHTLMLPLYGFEEGIYYLHIKVNNKIFTEVLVVN